MEVWSCWCFSTWTLCDYRLQKRENHCLGMSRLAFALLLSVSDLGTPGIPLLFLIILVFPSFPSFLPCKVSSVSFLVYVVRGFYIFM